MPLIYIDPHPLFYQKILWVCQLISQYTETKYEFTLDRRQSDISIGTATDDDIIVNDLFFHKLTIGQTKWKELMPKGPVILNENGQPSILETIFYLVNCIQELNPLDEEVDHYGRFKYTASLQYHYGIIEENYVARLIDQLISKFPILSKTGKAPTRQSQVFLSHDIDLVHSGWKIEAYLALKSFDIKLLGKVAKDILLQRPFYNNIDQVMAIDETYGFKSCFYWLPAYGKDEIGIMNADYTLSCLDEMSQKVMDNRFECGIHKSSFSTSLAEEMSRLPFIAEHNRYHFLKFQTHQAWREIEAAGLKTDASLGFAEHIGFRNSYGLPFIPFDMEQDRSYNFVEIPLHIMDVTIAQYMRFENATALDHVKNFLEQNNKNCVLSILWHNNEMTDYIHHDNNVLYKQILSALQDAETKHILAREIVMAHSIQSTL